MMSDQAAAPKANNSLIHLLQVPSVVLRTQAQQSSLLSALCTGLHLRQLANTAGLMWRM